MVDDVVVGFEDAIGEPIVPHELPDIFHGVELWAFRRQRDDGDVVGHNEACRQVPAGLIDQEHSVGTGRDGLCDLEEMQVHRFGIAGGHDKGRALALLWTDSSENIGRSSALIAGSARSRATLGPSARDLVLLADARLILEPDLYGLDVDRLFVRDLVQARGEVFLKSSIAPSAWA
jgi:hypothetical protein